MTIDTQLLIRDAVTRTQEISNRSAKVTSLAPSDQKSWLLEMGSALMGWDRVKDFTTLLEAEVLYNVWLVWEHNAPENRLVPSVTVKWEGNFWWWAASFTKSHQSKEPARVTITNKIGVFRDWISDEKCIDCPECVFIPTRDEYGEVVNSKLENEKDWLEIEFDPRKCDYGKLLVSRATARKGWMSEESWTALADPYVTVAVLKASLKEDWRQHEEGGDEEGGTIVRTASSDDDFTIFEENGMVYAGKPGAVVAVMQLIDESLAENPIARKAAEHMLGAVGCKFSTVLQENRVETSMPLAHVSEGFLVISKGAERIGQFDRDEAVEIGRVIGEMLEAE